MCRSKKALTAEPSITGSAPSLLRHHLLLRDWETCPTWLPPQTLQVKDMPHMIAARLASVWLWWERCLVKALICSLAPQLLSVLEARATRYSQGWWVQDHTPATGFPPCCGVQTDVSPSM